MSGTCKYSYERLAASTTTCGTMVTWVTWNSPLDLNEWPGKRILEILNYAAQQYRPSEKEDR